MNQQPLLQVNNLTTIFPTRRGTVQAVSGVSLTLQPGEILGVVGESGCGKSVTMLSILQLIPHPPGKIETGKAWFHNKDLLAFNSDEIRMVRGGQIGDDLPGSDDLLESSPDHREADFRVPDASSGDVKK